MMVGQEVLVPVPHRSSLHPMTPTATPQRAQWRWQGRRRPAALGCCAVCPDQGCSGGPRALAANPL
jgi:hypothetical protein